MTMIERAARAAFDHWKHQSQGAWHWENAPQHVRQYWLDGMRAVLAAIRDPDEAILANVGPATAAGFTRVLDAILQEKP